MDGPNAKAERSPRYRCPGCDYTYQPEQGDPREGFPAGTPWSAIPEGWACPDCAVREKPDFVEEPAGS
jgi:rubredoxin